MNIYIHRGQFKAQHGTALTIGNFDGVHRGHQALLEKIQKTGQNQNLTPLLMSFFPHPKTLITGQTPAILSVLRDRAFWLAHYGLRDWLLLSFTTPFSQLSAEDFLKNYLKPLKIKYLQIGADFRFGYRGQGDADFLWTQQKEYDYILEVIENIENQEEKISSSMIRSALQNHDLSLAEALLGHPLTYTGRVRTGAARGRTINTPTANLHLPEHFAVPDGVYGVKMGDIWGVANIGKAPTFNGIQRKLEAHFFENVGNLYQQIIQIEIKFFIRPEQKFNDIKALQKQIQSDIEFAHHQIKNRN